MNRYLLVIDRIPPPVLNDIAQLKHIDDYEDLAILLLTSTTERYTDYSDVKTVHCNFVSSHEIGRAMKPYANDIVGVFCTGETKIQYLQRVIPFLPKHVRVATPQALADSTNKRAMREAFAKHCPEATLQSIHAMDPSHSTIQDVEAHVPYPVIIKPASLASSMLIRVCHDRQELSQGLTETFGVIHKIYEQQKRNTPPQVIVEAYIEGDLYSVDMYIAEPPEMYFCPPVYYISNRSRGIDDFSLYKRIVPTELNSEETRTMNQTAACAVTALGLTHSSAHVELVLTQHGWKIIELGPRIGRYRHRMYSHAYGINHYLNDILLHLGKRPDIPGKLLKYCAAYSIYPESEGRLRKITGLDYLEHDPTIAKYNVRVKAGEACKFAKNGGKSVVEFYVVSEDKKTFDRSIAYVESNIRAITG